MTVEKQAGTRETAVVVHVKTLREIPEEEHHGVKAKKEDDNLIEKDNGRNHQALPERNFVTDLFKAVQAAPMPRVVNARSGTRKSKAPLEFASIIANQGAVRRRDAGTHTSPSAKRQLKPWAVTSKGDLGRQRTDPK